jgi:hypothetical protein
VAPKVAGSIPVGHPPIGRRLAALGPKQGALPANSKKLNNELIRLLAAFAEEIAAVQVLDPACGRGNFLYISLKVVRGYEKEIPVHNALNSTPS